MSLKGKIHSVTVNNFITYDSVKLFAGPYLNIIIGPNGTGKSTLVAAIVIAMGGNCGTLARGKKIEDYVKNGKTKAAVCVEVYRDEEQHLTEFYRSFDVKGGGSWKIDKRKVTQKTYLDTVRSYNIQVDNLCQFLPQDRVQDFAKMNPEEIFANTIKSVCREASGGKIKRSHIQLEELNRKSEETKRDLEAAKKSAKEHQRKLAPIEAECQEYTREVKRIDGEIAHGVEVTSKCDGDIVAMQRQTEEQEDKIRMAKVAVVNAKKHKESQEAEILEESNLLTALLHDFKATAGQQTQLNGEKTALKARIAEVQKETKELERKRHELIETLDAQIKPQILSTRRRIQELLDTEKQHLATMDSRFPDMYKATMWLRENQQTFRAKLKLKNAREGKYLENLISVRDLTAIVCEDAEDMKMLVKKLTSELHLKVNVLQSSAAQQVNYTPQVPIEQLSTYDSVKLFAGPYLNIIIGPNGTGKSTLVAAIVIAMGGNCGTLARGKKIEDYVKNGKSKAAVCVEVYRDEEQHLTEFYRSFDLKGGGSWKIDKRKVTQKTYLDTVRSYNIQVDNLCQFLPQDRVQDFAKMNPEEIFANTIKSVCSEEMNSQLEELREMEKSSNNSNVDLLKWKSELKEAEATNEQLRVRIENMEQRTALQEKLQVAKIKRSHIELEELSRKSEETKRDLEAAKKSAKEHQRKLAPIEAECQEYTREVKRIDGEIAHGVEVTSKCDGDIVAMQRQTEEQEDKIRMAKVAVVNAKKHKESQEAEILEESNLLTALLHDFKATAGQQTQLNGEKTALKARIAELKLKDAREGKYLENLISVRDLTAIVCEDAEDMKMLVKKLTSELHLKVNVLQSSAAQQVNYTPQVPIEQLRRFGFSKYLLDMVEGPFPILNYLCSIYKLHNIPLGTEQTDRVIDNVISSGHFKLFFTPNHRYAVVKSKYSSASSTTCIEIKGKKLLTVPVNPAIVQNERRALQELQKRSEGHSGEIGEFETRISRNEGQVRELNVALMEIEEKIQRFAGLGKRVKIQQQKLKNIQEMLIDVAAEEVKCQETTKESIRRMLETFRKMTQVLEKGEEAEVQLMFNRDYLQRFHSTNADLKARLCEAQSAAEEAKKLQESVQKALDDCRRAIGGQKEEIRTLIAAAFPANMKYTEREDFQELPATDEELVEMINSLQTQVDCMEGRNERIIEEYEARGRKIEELRERIAGQNGQNRQLQGRMEELHKRWFPAISDVINKINLKFSTFMASMDYAGEVALTRKNDELPATDEELVEMINSLQTQVDCMEGRNERIIEEYEARGRKIEELRERIAGQNGQNRQLQGRMEELHKRWFPAISDVINKINLKFSTFMASMDYAGEVALTRKNDHTYSSYGITIKVVYRNNESLQQLNSFLQSGGERTVAIATYTLALQQLSQVPFRCVDEINQGMDPKNERKIFNMLVEETSRPGMSQYFFITPKIIPNLNSNEHMVFHCVFNGPHIQSSVVFLDGTDSNSFLTQA
uniref:Structural maintenance of chromosomes protein 5 n=1 Tax=Lutzomyia longipalpis TaxID=7200 RepID=A0A1B0FUX9_LUTLO